MMSRRTCLAVIILTAAAIVVETASVSEAARNTMNVQVRVYRMSRPGFYHFIPNAPVQLSNGMRGVTSGAHGQSGCCFFRNLPQANYTARAYVGGRWYGVTGYQRFGTTLRINIQIP